MGMILKNRNTTVIYYKIKFSTIILEIKGNL